MGIDVIKTSFVILTYPESHFLNCIFSFPILTLRLHPPWKPFSSKSLELKHASLPGILPFLAPG